MEPTNLCSKRFNVLAKNKGPKYYSISFLQWIGRGIALPLIFNLCFTVQAFAQTNTWDGSSSANWNTAANWSLNQVPTAAHDVVIPNGITGTINVNTAAVCNTFTMNDGGTDNTVSISAGNSLTVTGVVDIGTGTGFGDEKTLAVNTGTLTCASILISTAGFFRTSRITVSTGTVNVTGNITMGSGAGTDAFQFTGAGTLNIGGTMTGGAFDESTSTVNYNGSDQSIADYTYYNLTLSGSGEKTPASALTVSNAFTLSSGITFTAGSLTHSIGGNWVNNGATFNRAGSTISLNGNAQSIGGSSATTFNNLSLDNMGTKTFNLSTTIDAGLYISTGVVANLGTFTTHTASGLTLGGIGQSSGTWGSSSSAAANQNDVYFAATTGYITTGSAGGTVYYSRQTGNWNNSATWSTVTYGNATNSTGSFPQSNDIVNIGGGNFTVTVNVNSACGELNFQEGTSNSPTVAISGTNTLDISGALNLTNAQFFSGDQNRLTVGTGTLNVRNIAFTTQALSGSPTITVSTGTVTVTDDVTHSGSDVGTITFTGAGLLELGGDFLNASALTFTPSTSTVEYNGSSAQVIGGLTYYNLVLNNSSGTIPQLTLGDNATTTNTLTITQGVVNLDGNTFTLGASGAASTLSRAASTTTNWMYGGTFSRYWRSGFPVTSTSGGYYGLFPVGTSASSTYRPVAVNSTVNPTGTGAFNVSHTDATNTTDLSPVYDDGGTDILRKHDAQYLITSTATGGTYNMGVTMTDLNDIGSLSDIRLAKSIAATTVISSGSNAPATGSVGNPTGNRTGVSMANLIGDWRITTTNMSATPLPVTWLSFDGRYIENERMVQLDWATASEENNSGFYIERSINGYDFEELGFVEGSGTNSNKHQFSFLDTNVETSSYYRLRQVDYDGKFEYSKWVFVSIINPTDEKAIYVYPNPTDGYFKIGGQLSEVYDILVTSLSGIVIVQLNDKNLRDAETLINQSLEKYSSGMFIIKFHNPGITKTISLIKS